MTRYDAIKEALDRLSISDLVEVHNNYCDADDKYDDHIYSMEDFDEIMSGKTPWEIARCAYYGDFCPAHDYFWFNGYANLESSDFSTGRIYTDDIAEYIDRTEDALYCDELQEILDEYEDAEDEEEE